MSSRPASPLGHPFMLDDLAVNCQRLSARLPPDGWDPEVLIVRVKRQGSGALDICHRGNAGRDNRERVTSARLASSGGRDEEAGLLPTTETPQVFDGDGVSQKSLKEALKSLKSWLWSGNRKAHPNSGATVSSTKSVFEHFKARTKSLWPFHGSKPHERPRYREHKVEGSELPL